MKNKITLGRLVETIPGGRTLLQQYRRYRSRQLDFLLQNTLNAQLEASNKLSEPVIDWWNQAHSNHDTKGFWLTGSEPKSVWSRLNIENLIKPGTIVLNIGIGKGICTRSLYEKGCITHVLDISEVALRNVAQYTARAWTPDQLQNLPVNYFDLAISHLVTQHMNNHDLELQLCSVINSLKPNDGIFAMQFAFCLDDENKLPDDSNSNCKSGGVCRGLKYMDEIIRKCGGIITWHKRVEEFSNYNSGWYAIHIHKQDF